MSDDNEKLNLEGNLQSNLKELGCLMVDSMISQIHENTELDEKVHELRKALKKIRALLRMVREQIEPDIFDRENQRYRDIGRQLEALREAKVRIETLTALLENYEHTISKEVFESLVNTIEETHRKHVSAFGPDQWNELEVNLANAKNDVKLWIPEANDFDAFSASIKKVYRRGLKAYLSVREQPDAEIFHELRKRAKYLRYQLRFLEDMWPKVFTALEDSMHDLTDFLGDDHDLHDLKSWLEEHDWPHLSTKEHDLLGFLIQNKQNELRTPALDLASKAYSEKPGRFINRMESYW
jgi:CHAD domain-containing protein